MRSNVIKIGALAISFGIVAGLVLYADPGKFADLVAKSNYVFLVAALAVSTANLFVRSLKWHVLLKKVSFSTIMPIQMLGITISNFSPGKIAEPVKCIVLKLRTGMAVATTLPSVIWERFLDILVLLVLSIVGIVFFMPLTGSLAAISLVCFAAFVVVIGAVLLFFYKTSFRALIFRLLKRFPILNRLSENFIETFSKSRVEKKGLLLSFIASLVAWLLEGVIIYLCLLSLGVGMNPVALAAVFALATLIGVATTLPGGIGSTDAVMIIFLSALGVDHTVAIAGVLISRFLSLWYANLVGGISLFYIARKSKLGYRAIFK
jgi:glycosyltransferase 2 family protein